MSDETPTIAALLTPLAPGAIAVVALAGPRTDAILRDILRKGREDQPLAPTPARPTLCRIVDGDTFLDDAVTVRLDDPRGSRAELCTHGGVRIAQRLLQLLERGGAQVVPAQEYCDVVAPIHRVERDVDAALLRSPSRRLTLWLLSQRSILPSYLDRLDHLAAAEREAFIARSRVAIRLLRGLSIAIIGPPNAGKSTLANRLIGRDRVITSDVPGTTRDWVAETALLQGWPVTLTDTAGIRETECAIESEAIHRGREQARRADLVLMVLDATTVAAEQSANMGRLREMLPHDAPHLVVLNKCDLPSAPSPFKGEGRGEGDAKSEYEPHPSPPLLKGREQSASAFAHISALTGAGVDTLELQIADHFGFDLLVDGRPTAFMPSQAGELHEC